MLVISYYLAFGKIIYSFSMLTVLSLVMSKQQGNQLFFKIIQPIFSKLDNFFIIYYIFLYIIIIVPIQTN